MLMFEGNALLNLVKFGSNPRVVLIAVGVKAGQSLQAISGSVMVNEPLRSFSKETRWLGVYTDARAFRKEKDQSCKYDRRHHLEAKG